MLGPPNGGSEIVERWANNRLFRWFMGPGGLEMGTGEHSAGMRLPPVDYPVGVVAGSRSMNWILSAQIPGVDDGKVSTDRARVEGMSDFIVLPVSHPFMLASREIFEQTEAFLRTGAFRMDENVD